MNKKMKNEVFVRTDEIKSVDRENKTIELSFASDKPYERWFGVEILRIDENSIDFSRLNNSAPLLFNHDRDLVIGVVEKAWIEGNKAKARVRFGNSEKAKEVFEDVKDGILKNVSVGYEIDEMKLVGERDGVETYEVVRWLPLEVSIVSIPADDSVGVGRSKEKLNLKKGDEKMDKENKTQQIDLKEVKEEARKQETIRVKEILALGSKFKKEDLAKKAIDDGVSVDEFRAMILNSLESAKPIDTKAKDLNIGMSEKEKKEYSLLRAIRALANPHDKRAQEEAKFEFEVSYEAQRRAGIEAQGILVPFDVLDRSLTAGGEGGNVIGERLLTGSFIELLKNKSAVLQYATHLTGLTGNIAIPRQTSSTTVYEVAETEALTDSDITLDQITLSPKRLGATTSYSKQLIAQTSLDVENLLRNDMLTQIALKIDMKVIEKILNETGVGLVEIGDNGGEPEWKHFVGLESEITTANADVKRMRYILNAKTLGYCKTKTKVPNYPAYIVENNQINGYGINVSNQIPSNLTKGDGTDLSAILFGNFADLLVGFWGGVDIIVDPYSKKKQGLVEITADQFYDLGIRHPESFAVIKDAKV